MITYKNMPKILSDRIVWDKDDWLAGQVPQADNGFDSGMGNGSFSQRNINPYRMLGGIAPGYLPVSAVNVDNIDAVIRAGDSDYSGATPYAYLLGGEKLYRLNLSTDTISNTAPWTHSIAHGGHTNIDGQDMKIVSILNSSTSAYSTVALYSFSDATDGEVGAYDVAGDAFIDNFLSTLPTGAITLTTDPHPMIFSERDGGVYIGNGNTLIKLNTISPDGGSNGAVTVPLAFPNGTIIKSFTEYPNYLVIFAYRSSGGLYRGEATAYFWDYVSEKFNFQYDLSDNLVTAGFNWLGTIGCFTYGRAGDGGVVSTKLKLFNGTRFKQVAEYPTNPPGHGSVEIYDSMIMWNFGDNTQSYIGSYGSPWSSRIAGGLNYWGEPTGAGLDLGTTGMCKNLGGIKLYTSSGANNSASLEVFNGNYGPKSSEASFVKATLAEPSFPYQTRGKVKSVKIHFKKASTAGRTLALTLTNDNNDLTTVFSGIGTIKETSREYIMDVNNQELPYFSSLWPQLTWDTGTDGTDAPIPTKIEVFFDVVNNIQ